MIDFIVFSVVSIAIVAWVLICFIFMKRYYNHKYQALDPDSENGSKKKKRKVKKFEDYWDDEGDESSRGLSQTVMNPTQPNGANRSGGVLDGPTSTHYEEFWDDSVDFSSHSIDPFNISTK